MFDIDCCAVLGDRWQIAEVTLARDVCAVRETDDMDVVSAVAEFVRSSGVNVGNPVLLRSTNNVVVWLAPSNIVAKIAVNNSRAADERLAAEMLVARGAPVVAPATGLGDRVHSIGGTDVTFWTYVPPASTTPTSLSVAVALASLHEHMSDLGNDLRLADCHGPLLDTLHSLDRDNYAPQLKIDDRRLLAGAIARGLEALDRRAGWQPIHGSPHRFNIVVDANEPKFIDLETIIVGPVEWDLAHLESQVCENYAGQVDHRLLGVLRSAISAMTSALCWHDTDRGPDMIEHATHHLEIVRLHGRNGHR